MKIDFLAKVQNQNFFLNQLKIKLGGGVGGVDPPPKLKILVPKEKTNRFCYFFVLLKCKNCSRSIKFWKLYYNQWQIQLIIRKKFKSTKKSNGKNEKSMSYYWTRKKVKSLNTFSFKNTKPPLQKYFFLAISYVLRILVWSLKF